MDKFPNLGGVLVLCWFIREATAARATGSEGVLHFLGIESQKLF